MWQIAIPYDFDEIMPNLPDPDLLFAYGAAVSDCRHESLFTVWDEPIAVFICEGCGMVFTGDSDSWEAELVRPFAEALERDA